MSVILEELKEAIDETGYYTSAFWKKVGEISNRNKRAFSQFLIHYLESVNSEYIERKQCQLILALVLGIYNFEEDQIDDLGKSIVNSIRAFSKISNSNKKLRRDHLLYLVMDILEHCPEIITDTNIETQENLYNVISSVGKLEYILTEGTDDSYLMNYKIINFRCYFREEEWRRKIGDMYLNHFDPRIRDEMEEELGNL